MGSGRRKVEMGRRVELSPEAKTRREGLPPNVVDGLDELIARLAASPPNPPRSGAVDHEGIAPDGTHYYIEILCRFDDTTFSVDSIEPEAY